MSRRNSGYFVSHPVSTMAQSYSGSMLQSHNDGANVEPFQVTREARSSAI